MRRELLVIATIGIMLGLVVAAPAGATTLAENHSPTAVDDGTLHYQTTDDGNETTAFDGNETEGVNETESANETDEANETVEASETEAIGPGTYLSGAVGAHRAELEGTVTERAFGLSVAAAVSNDSKAGLVANQTERLETRLQELEQSRDQLETAHENGSIQNSTYQVKLTALEARITATERMINRTIAETDRLPHAVRQAHGVNETRLDHLRSQASNLTGPEVAEIARGIGGPMTGHPAGVRGPPAHAGPGTRGPPGTVTGDENNTIGSGPTNTTRGPPTNTTRDHGPNGTSGPPENGTMGPGNEMTRGPPDDRTKGPSGERGWNTTSDRSTR